MKITVTSQVLALLQNKDLSVTEIAQLINKSRCSASAAVMRLARSNLVHICKWEPMLGLNVKYAVYTIGAGLRAVDPSIKTNVLNNTVTFTGNLSEQSAAEVKAKKTVVKRMPIVTSLFGSGPAPSLMFREAYGMHDPRGIYNR